MRISTNQLARSGQSLVEFTLVVPLVFLLIINVVNFGKFFYGWITLANAARAAANYRIQGSKTVGSPSLPVTSEITNLINFDTATLDNRGTLYVRICWIDQADNTTVICDPAADTGKYPNPAPDTRAEGPLFEMLWVDIAYEYRPVVEAFNFPSLGIYLTLPPSTIRRQVVMRTMN